MTRRSQADAHGAPVWAVGVGVLLFLLAVDVLFIAIDATAGATADFPPVLHVYHEGGIPEWVQYIKFIVGAILMFLLARRTVGLYAVWGGVFVYLFVDDAFMLHERVAGHSNRLLGMDDWFDLPFEVWVLIEPLFMVGVGIAILAALWYVDRRSSTPMARRFSIQALAFLVLLGAFAALGDFLGHAVFERAHSAEVFEDGGEMIAGSLLLALSVHQVVLELGGVRHLWPR